MIHNVLWFDKHDFSYAKIVFYFEDEYLNIIICFMSFIEDLVMIEWYVTAKALYTGSANISMTYILQFSAKTKYIYVALFCVLTCNFHIIGWLLWLSLCYSASVKFSLSIHWIHNSEKNLMHNLFVTCEEVFGPMI